MSNYYFPVTLPGLHFAGREPFAVTTTQIADNGKRFVCFKYEGYRYRFEAKFLRIGAAEHTTLNNFWNTHHGSWDSFLLTDPWDSTERRVRFASESLSFEKEKGFYTATVDLETVAP